MEGVLISHIQDVFEEEHIEALRRAGIPVVSINGERRTHVPLICDNLSKAFELLTRHLLDVGHRRILNLASSDRHLRKSRTRTLSQRVQGFRQAIEERGSWEVCTEREFFEHWPRETKGDGGISGLTVKQNPGMYSRLEQPVYKFCKRLFATGKLPDAIVCSNDTYATEAIVAALECGVRIPGDMAVTGYDNDRLGAFPIFGITTAEQDIESICRKAVETLIQRMADPNQEVKHQVFDSKIILRTSCGRMQAPVPADGI